MSWPFDFDDFGEAASGSFYQPPGTSGQSSNETVTIAELLPGVSCAVSRKVSCIMQEKTIILE